MRQRPPGIEEHGELWDVVVEGLVGEVFILEKLNTLHAVIDCAEADIALPEADEDQQQILSPGISGRLMDGVEHQQRGRESSEKEEPRTEAPAAIPTPPFGIDENQPSDKDQPAVEQFMGTAFAAPAWLQPKGECRKEEKQPFAKTEENAEQTQEEWIGETRESRIGHKGLMSDITLVAGGQGKTISEEMIPNKQRD